MTTERYPRARRKQPEIWPYLLCFGLLILVLLVWLVVL